MRCGAHFYWLCFWVCFFEFSKAQEKKMYRFSLDSAQVYALKNNFSAIRAEKNITKTQKRIREIIAQSLPQISAKVDYQNFIQQPGSMVPAAMFDPTAAIIAAAKEYFGIDPIKEYTPQTGLVEMRFGQPVTLNASVTLKQEIFDGDKLITMQTFRNMKKIGESTKAKTILTIKELVRNSYAGVLIAKENLKILEENQKYLVKNLEDTQKSLDNGLVEEEEVEQLKITVYEGTQKIQDAQRKIKAAINLFKHILGIDIYQPAEVVFQESLEKFTNPIMPQVFQENVLYENLPEYQLQKMNLTNKALLLKSEKFKHLPSLSAFLTHSRIANRENSNFFNKDQFWQKSTLLGVTLKIPVFSSFKQSYRIQQAKIALEESDVGLEELKNKIKLDHDNAQMEYHFALSRLENSKKSITLSKSIVEKIKTKFNVGTATSFELSAAYRQLFAKQQNYLQALLSLVQAKGKLYRILNK